MARLVGRRNMRKNWRHSLESNGVDLIPGFYSDAVMFRFIWANLKNRPIFKYSYGSRNRMRSVKIQKFGQKPDIGGC